jgi:hypothetical protein
VDAGERRVGGDRRDAVRRIGREGEQDRAVVEQERVGAGVVGPERLAIEIGGVDLARDEGAAVEDDVAADLAHAGLLQAPRQQPEALEDELRIAVALDVDVAGEDAVDDRPLQPDRRRPGVRRAEQLEGGEGRDELHQRGRIDGLVGLPGGARPRRIDLLHPRDHRVARHAAARERRLDAARQAACIAGLQGERGRRRRPRRRRRERAGDGEQRCRQGTDRRGAAARRRGSDGSRSHAAMIARKLRAIGLATRR